ncbi:hypothetical protein H6F86_14085 [Phormidium sp. FACHB-592]|uniref:DUF2238 domain-containing protein n=1 Tax=Stenomitos frigidus AS-A4 TaxID=2933935 RepID=A0ABV0KQD9_9CYAN|nr:hypothetical protein [Phormidium sp. FACHB-592]MBD2075002.1 hypothetical protein [Phormidium sp. FACHB-592]
MFSFNWQGYRTTAWIGEALLALTVVAALIQGHWSNALALVCFLLAFLAFMLLAKQLPTLFDLFFIVAALLNAGGWVWGWFYLPGIYDEAVHGFTMFAITLALSFLTYGALLTAFHDHKLLYLAAIASFGIAIGALWEIAEWAAGNVLSTPVIGSVDDTVIDLAMDTLGSGLAALISLWALEERVHSRVSPHRRPKSQSHF